MIFLSVLFACGPTNGGVGEGDPNGGLVSLTISPTEATLRTSTEAPPTQVFTVTATFANGHVEEGFDQVAWSLTNTSAGELDETGMFAASTTNGGRTYVVAAADGLEALADVTVIYTDTLFGEGAPGDAADAFAGAATPDAALSFAYPTEGVAVPRNLPRMDFHVADPTGAGLYRWVFDSSTTQVEVYTTAAELSAEGDLWRTITATNAGADVTVSITAASVDLSGGVVGAVTALREGQPLTMRVNRLDATGSIYFFVTTESGIAKAGVADPDWAYWFSNFNGNTAGNCVGCHVVSADGDRMSYSFIGAVAGNRFGLAALADGEPEPVVAHDNGADDGYFTAIDPAGELVAVAFNGTIDVHDAADGALVGTIAYDEALTMPDWAPDGSALVAVAGLDMATDNVFHDSWIVAFPHLGDGRFGAPEVLVEPELGTWFYYPAYSPDGRWVAYNRSRQGSYFSSDASLWLMPAEGGEAIELAALNGTDGNASWPRWGPIPDDDVLWLAFSSDRDFGVYDTPHPQVWIGAIDGTLAEQGLDPSAPAFRMPQQDLEKGNHAPWWSAY